MFRTTTTTTTIQFRFPQTIYIRSYTYIGLINFDLNPICKFFFLILN